MGNEIMVVLEQSREYNGEPSLLYHGLSIRRRRFACPAEHFSEIYMRISTRVIGGALIATLLTQLTACGTIFYPDRRGQIGGKIDPVVAAMDAIGILFYVIPGLIAFGIDFATGAIYYSGGRSAQVDPVKLREAVSPDGKVDNLKLQAILESELGQRLPLNDPRLIQHRGSIEQLASMGLVPAA
ncbi:hypothetical protein D3C81_1039010 [compost metagenome]